MNESEKTELEELRADKKQREKKLNDRLLGGASFVIFVIIIWVASSNQ